MMAKKIDFKAVQESRARLKKLMEEHPELADEAADKDQLAREWEQDLEGILDMDKMTFTIQEAAELLSCHPDTIRRAIRAGKLKAAAFGKGIRISRADLEKYYQDLGGGTLFGDAWDEGQRGDP